MDMFIKSIGFWMLFPVYIYQFGSHVSHINNLADISLMHFAFGFTALVFVQLPIAALYFGLGAGRPV